MRAAKEHSASKNGVTRSPGVVLAEVNRNAAANDALTLQRTAGNQAVHRLLESRRSMRNEASDRYEMEADQIAYQATSHGDRSQDWGTGIVSENEGASSNSRGGTVLDPQTRAPFESFFGRSFADVRIHTDRLANERAGSLNARAYTFGNDITFGPSEYQPGSTHGRHLLAHELAHVVQQSNLAGSWGNSAHLSRIPAPAIQRKVTATGDVAGFVALANSIISVQNEIKVSSTGEVKIQPSKVEGPPTRDAVELLKALRTAIDDPKTITVRFIRGSTPGSAADRNVIVGNYALSTIDLDDVEAFGRESSHSRQGDNAAVQLVHEFTEQYRKQAKNEDFPTAHRAGLAAQERLLGATLQNETPMTPIGGDLGEVTSTYRYPDGRIVDVTTRMNFRTGQIVDVRRNIR